MDIFVIIFFLVVGLVQWLSQRKQEPDEHLPPNFPEGGHARERSSPSSERSEDWRELMEALGRARQEESDLREAGLPPIPPPVPANDSREGTMFPTRPVESQHSAPMVRMSSQARAEFSNRVMREENLERMQAEAEKLEAEARAIAQRTAAKFRTPARQISANHRRDTIGRRLMVRLRDQASVREAIVLNEVLQKPVAMREPEANSHSWS